MHKNKYHFLGKNVSSRRTNTTGYIPGNCCIGIAWKYSSQYQITPVRDFCNDRICTLMYHLQSNQIIYIIGVYMPQRNRIKDDFSEYLAHIAVLIERNRNHNFIIIGDFNSHFGESVSKGSWGKSCKNGKQILNFIDRYSLEIGDISDKGSGPCYTYQYTVGGISYIDHCI